jgi:hypothetical protein
LPLVFADVSFYLNPHFSLGFGIGISNSTKNAVFRFSDENENEYEEYFEINATLSSFYGKPTIKFGSIKGFKPYFSTAVGLSVLNVYFDNFYFSGERIEHFLDGHLYFKQFYLRPSFGVSHKFFNIGDLAVEVGYVYTSGDNIYNVDEYEWKYNTRGIYINGVYERSF